MLCAISFQELVMMRAFARRFHSAWFIVLVLLLSGCFQSASDDAPTPVNLTAIAPFQNVTPTAFVTPLPPGGFVPAGASTPADPTTPTNVNASNPSPFFPPP